MRWQMSRASATNPSTRASMTGSRSTARSCAPIEQTREVDQVDDAAVVHDLHHGFRALRALLFDGGQRQTRRSRDLLAVERDDPTPSRIDDEQHRGILRPAFD